MPNVEKRINQVASLNFRLLSEIKVRMEKAALISGVTVMDFAATALVGASEEGLENTSVKRFQTATAIIILEYWKIR